MLWYYADAFLFPCTEEKKNDHCKCHAHLEFIMGTSKYSSKYPCFPMSTHKKKAKLKNEEKIASDVRTYSREIQIENWAHSAQETKRLKWQRSQYNAPGREIHNKCTNYYISIRFSVQHVLWGWIGVGVSGGGGGDGGAEGCRHLNYLSTNKRRRKKRRSEHCLDVPFKMI